MDWEGDRRGHPGWAAWGLVSDIIDFTIFRSGLTAANAANARPEEIIARALELDERFRARMGEDLPEVWRYEVVYTGGNEMPELFWDGGYHLYPSPLTLQIWSGMGSCHILLHEIIRGNLLPFPTPQTHVSAEILQKMQAEILASVPHHFKDDPAGKSLRNGDPNSLLLWVLYLVCVMDTTTEEVKMWVVRRLRVLRRRWGTWRPVCWRGLLSGRVAGREKCVGAFIMGLGQCGRRRRVFGCVDSVCSDISIHLDIECECLLYFLPRATYSFHTFMISSGRSITPFPS